jgi:hypothetical protein
MSGRQKSRAMGLTLAGGYALLLSMGILCGTVGLLIRGSDADGPAVRMPASAALIGMSLAGIGIGLLRNSDRARLAFFAVAPWGSIALGSAFPSILWREDVPYTAVAILAYVPIAFVLARGSSLHAVGAKDGRWRSRGGVLLLACAGAMLLARLMVVASKPGGSAGGGLLGAYRNIAALNEYVQRLVLCTIPLLNYTFAFLAVSIPTRYRPAASVAESPPTSQRCAHGPDD